MFIAHLPAGFLVTRALLKNQQQHKAYVLVFLAGLLASIAPDFDLAYFHLIDNRQHPHHSYWTHTPIYWLAIFSLLSYPVYRRYKSFGIRVLFIVLICGLLHHTLDSIASGIRWLYPLSKEYIGLWRIPRIYDWWVANYLFHWTFVIELTITTAAAYVAWRDRALRLRFKYQLLFWLYRWRPSQQIMQKLLSIAESLR